MENELQKDVLALYYKKEDKITEKYTEKAIVNSLKFMTSREPDIFKTFSEDNTYANMIRSGSKGKVTHMTSLHHLGIQMQGQELFPRGDHFRYNPYHPVRVGLREMNCIYDGLYHGFNS